MTFESGPYLKIACFCERSLQEKDGVLSLIRVVDRVTHTRAGPDAPAEMPAFPYSMTAVVMLVSGQARGRHELKIEPEQPSGLKKPTFTTTVHMEGEDKGQNVVMNLRMTFDQEGLWWFNVYLDDHLLTRMPFRVMYQRMLQPGPRPK